MKLKNVALLASLILLSISMRSFAQDASQPIPSQIDNSQIANFIGQAATPTPINAFTNPQNPFMASNGSSNMHHDGYMSDVYAIAGPLGMMPNVRSTSLGHSCPSMAFASPRLLIALCLNLESAGLFLIDAQTLTTLATLDLPTNPVESLTDFPAGSLFLSGL